MLGHRMAHGSLLGLFVLSAAAAFQVWVTVRVYRSRLYEPSQKSAQAKLIWLLPVLGAIAKLAPARQCPSAVARAVWSRRRGMCGRA
jgi:beta-lactamase regulating signal transducer with metallopeptidase domain